MEEFMITKEKYFVELCSDTTFKYLIKKEDTRNWFFEIIKRKTNLDLNEFSLIDNELNSGNKIKDYRMDIVFEKEDTIVIIEMTNSSNISNYVKNYQYLYRTASRRFLSGEKYKNKRTILVLFNDFKNPENSNLLDAHFIFTDKDNKLVIKDIESYEIYLPNYEKACYDKYDEIERRLVLFNIKSYEEMESITKDSFDLKIIKEMRNLSMDEVFLTDYEKEIVQKKLVNSAYDEGLEKGFKQGIEQGIEQGIYNRNFEIAKKMLEEGLDLETISKWTNLSIEEIKKF